MDRHRRSTLLSPQLAEWMDGNDSLKYSVSHSPRSRIHEVDEMYLIPIALTS